MQRNIKLGDRIYYEYLDGSIGSAIVTKISEKADDLSRGMKAT